MENCTISEFHTLFWDFDGVILNSNTVRDNGFERVLAAFPEKEVNQLLDFHQKNGGLSRYVKFRYFFEEIRNESVTDEKIQTYANRFSEIMKVLLTDRDLLIQETIKFIKTNFQKIPMIIVSGSDQDELRYLCEKLEIKQFFKRIHGSPKPKMDWVRDIVLEEQLNPTKCLLIGDSYNDYEAANLNKLPFMGYNNPEVEKLSNKRVALN
jgi:HAD superfamily hydrolase (TIGR01549 family)